MNIEINYSAELVGYKLGAGTSGTDVAQRDHAASLEIMSSLTQSAYELATELRGMGPTARVASRQRWLAAARASRGGAASGPRCANRSRLAARRRARPATPSAGHRRAREQPQGPHRLRRSSARGWINIDNYPAPLAINLDWGLPLPDRSARYVFLAHLLEHLFHPMQSSHLLAEIRRVLMPGGVVRIVVPDIEKCLRAYADKDDAFFAERRRQWMLSPDSTNLELPCLRGRGPDAGKTIRAPQVRLRLRYARALPRAGGLRADSSVCTSTKPSRGAASGSCEQQRIGQARRRALLAVRRSTSLSVARALQTRGVPPFPR